MSKKIRVGMVGITPNRGFSSIAHMPALQALPQFEIVAVCTTRQESADAAAKHYGARLAFADPVKLAQCADVDLVTVCVKVPDHYGPVMAAIEAGKHVYSEWPLGRTTEEAIHMRDAADRAGVRHAVGLQGQASPAVNYVRDLIAQGYCGRVLSVTMFVNAAGWGATLDRSYQASVANGANLMTIPGGHNLDVLCHILGEFRELTAMVISQRDTIQTDDSGVVPKDVPDQLLINGRIGEAAISFQVRGGMARGTEFMLEIHGDAGDLSLSPTMRTSTQRQELIVRGARGSEKEMADLTIPAEYRWVPAGMPTGSPYNVGQLYAKLAEAILEGKPASPSFDAAVTRHRLLDAVVTASKTGQKQIL